MAGYARQPRNKTEEIRVKEIFRKFDADSSGSIEREEIEKVLRTLDWQLFNKENCRKIFKSMDSNGDGHVDMQEFMAWIFADDDFASLILREGLKGQAATNFTGRGQPPDGEWSYQWGFMKYAKAHLKFLADGRISGHSEATPSLDINHGGKIVDGGWTCDRKCTKAWWRTQNDAGRAYLHEAEITLQPGDTAKLEGVWKPDPLPPGQKEASATQRMWGRSDGACHFEEFDPSKSEKKKNKRHR